MKKFLVIAIALFALCVVSNAVAEETVKNNDCISVSEDDYLASLKIIDEISIYAFNSFIKGEKENADMTQQRKSINKALNQRGCLKEDRDKLKTLRSKFKKATEYWVSENNEPK
jgi:hypothetical protein